MSLSRSPSPIPGGGWSSPGLDITSSGRSTPAKMTFSGPNVGAVTWESARVKSRGVTSYPSFSTQNQGFFTRHMRRISSSLPSFSNHNDNGATEKDKPRPARWRVPLLERIRNSWARIGRKWKVCALIATIVLACYILFYVTRESSPWDTLFPLLTFCQLYIITGGEPAG